MRPTRRTLTRALLLLTLILPASVGCGTNAPPVGSPSAAPTTTIASPAPSATSGPAPTATPAQPTPTQSVPTPSTPVPPPGWTVVSSRVAYQWRWPGGGVTVNHTYPVPPVAELVSIGAGNHPDDPGDRPYNRMSFSFTTAYPTYTFEYVNQLVADGSGQPIPLAGLGVLRIVFTPAQAHNPAGTASSIQSQPPAHLGMARMVEYARAGDFEGHLSYGIGITWPDPHSNAQIAVRVYEVTYTNSHGEHRYVIAFDIDAR